MLLCYSFNICAVTKHSSTNLLCTNLASLLLLSSLPHLLLPPSCFSVTSCVCPPSSESQAPWLFQSPTRSKPSLVSTTPAGLVGSSRSRREHLCFCSREPPMTGGRDDITVWTDWCHINTLWSKTCKSLDLKISSTRSRITFYSWSLMQRFWNSHQKKLPSVKKT